MVIGYIITGFICRSARAAQHVNADEVNQSDHTAFLTAFLLKALIPSPKTYCGQTGQRYGSESSRKAKYDDSVIRHPYQAIVF